MTLIAKRLKVGLRKVLNIGLCSIKRRRCGVRYRYLSTISSYSRNRPSHYNISHRELGWRSDNSC